MVRKKGLALLLLVLAMSTRAQLKVDAELRPRFEYRHGVKTLFANNLDPAMFVSQRTRLNAGFKKDKLDFYLSLQDVRIWGDVPQLNASDNNGLAIHQAWGKLALHENLSLKIGRQEVAYDDQRILGSVGWAQQARSHDIAILKFQKNTTKIDFGIAFNQSKEKLSDTKLETPKTYKSLQYVWAHHNWTDFSASMLFLNNGVQFEDYTKYSQTLGTHLKKEGLLEISANLYYQFGKDQKNNDLSAFLLGLNASYKASEKASFTLGGEFMSGNDNGVITDSKNKAFTPFYGTNHKFNGFMDYFYVGNHVNTIGLLDAYLSTKFKLNTDSSLMLAIHNFSAAADFSEKQLGNELDFVFSHKLQESVIVKTGYSHMFALSGMELLKGNTDGNTNNWGWIMLIIKPNLL